VFAFSALSFELFTRELCLQVSGLRMGKFFVKSISY